MPCAAALYMVVLGSAEGDAEGDADEDADGDGDGDGDAARGCPIDSTGVGSQLSKEQVSRSQRSFSTNMQAIQEPPNRLQEGVGCIPHCSQKAGLSTSDQHRQRHANDLGARLNR